MDFPIDWQHENQRSQAKGRDAYKIQSSDGQEVSCRQGCGPTRKKAQNRLGSEGLSGLTWRWRLHKAPSGSEPIAAIYASLDTDLLFIPVFTKYIWSAEKPEGTFMEGGMFSGSELVVQSGVLPVGEWIEERIECLRRLQAHS